MEWLGDVKIGQSQILCQFGKLAKLANGSVLVTSGATQVLVTVCLGEEISTQEGWCPLGVEYSEKSYAVGRIPGGYNKREGRPSDHATLMARLIDRPLRACFPKNFSREVLVSVTVLSYEKSVSPVSLAILGASSALMVSDIPFDGPVAALKMSFADGEWRIAPEDDLTHGDMTVACVPEGVLMVEAGVSFLSEDCLIHGMKIAHEAMKPLFELQKEAVKALGKTKKEVCASSHEENDLMELRNLSHYETWHSVLTKPSKVERAEALDQLKKQFQETLGEKWNKRAFEVVKEEYLRNITLEGKRIDGRAWDEIRPLSCEIGILARPHGSALFSRGETQSLAVVTLASEDEQQRSEMLWNFDVRERFLLHYNFPPFSVGEAKMQRATGRREIGHGNLARRAILPALPSSEAFSYTIRVVAETLSSNGSSSMAAVCGTTLALQHAGVPLKQMIAGIAMGLIKEKTQEENKRWAVLSDISGEEDALGDMDFKVCGSAEGVTALQMDLKCRGIDWSILEAALEKAKVGRLQILETLKKVISEPRILSEGAPRIVKIKIPQEKVRDLIGAGGKTIKKISSESKARLEVSSDGVVQISAPNSEAAKKAKSLVRIFTMTPCVGDIHKGKVVRLTDFGAFVEIRPGLEGLCHISHLDDHHVQRIEDAIEVGAEIIVKILDIDKQGRIKLSRRDAVGQKVTDYEQQDENQPEGLEETVAEAQEEKSKEELKEEISTNLLPS